MVKTHQVLDNLKDHQVGVILISGDFIPIALGHRGQLVGDINQRCDKSRVLTDDITLGELLESSDDDEKPSDVLKGQWNGERCPFSFEPRLSDKAFRRKFENGRG